MFFENVECVKCRQTLAFLPDIMDVSTLEPDPAGDNAWRALTPAAGVAVYHQCRNWPYCCAHPWEDWAETFAHYLHIMDTVETAAVFGMTLQPEHPEANLMTTDPGAVPEVGASFDLVLNNWLPLTYALNSLNRGMGLSDLYPFVLSSPAIEKLRFIHETVQGSGSVQAQFTQSQSC